MGKRRSPAFPLYLSTGHQKQITIYVGHDQLFYNISPKFVHDFCTTTADKNRDWSPKSNISSFQWSDTFELPITWFQCVIQAVKRLFGLEFTDPCTSNVTGVGSMRRETMFCRGGKGGRRKLIHITIRWSVGQESAHRSGRNIVDNVPILQRFINVARHRSTSSLDKGSAYQPPIFQDMTSTRLNCTEYGQLILRKMIEIPATRSDILK